MPLPHSGDMLPCHHMSVGLDDSADPTAEIHLAATLNAGAPSDAGGLVIFDITTSDSGEITVDDTDIDPSTIRR